jgi:hypothetical protein
MFAACAPSGNKTTGPVLHYFAVGLHTNQGYKNMRRSA